MDNLARANITIQSGECLAASFEILLLIRPLPEQRARIDLVLLAKSIGGYCEGLRICEVARKRWGVSAQDTRGKCIRNAL